MDYFLNWIKGVASFYIVSSVIINVLPGVKYKKYIKLFVGTVTIILCMKPVGNFFEIGNTYDTSYKNQEYNIMSKELTAQIKYADESRYEMIAAEYRNMIKEDIKEYVVSIGAEFKDAKTELDYTTGELTLIEVTVSRKNAYKGNYVENIDISISKNPEEEMLALEIKNYLSGFYDIEKRNIRVIFE